MARPEYILKAYGADKDDLIVFSYCDTYAEAKGKQNTLAVECKEKKISIAAWVIESIQYEESKA